MPRPQRELASRRRRRSYGGATCWRRTNRRAKSEAELRASLWGSRSRGRPKTSNPSFVSCAAHVTTRFSPAPEPRQQLPGQRTLPSRHGKRRCPRKGRFTGSGGRSERTQLPTRWQALPTLRLGSIAPRAAMTTGLFGFYVTEVYYHLIKEGSPAGKRTAVSK